MTMQKVCWMLVVVLMLAACGGGDDAPEVDGPIEPTPIVQLPDDVRVGYAPGTTENPIRMVMMPVDTVAQRIPLLLEEALEAQPPAYEGESSLRDDLGLSNNLSELTPLLLRDFNISVYSYDLENLQTVNDLVAFVENEIGEQVAASIFNTTGRLNFEVVLVENSGDALAALCDSGNGILSIAWLNAFTYAAALANRCGEPALLMAVGENRRDDFVNIPRVIIVEATPEAEVTAEVTAETTAEAAAEAAAEATAEATTEATAEVTAEPTIEPTIEPTPTNTPVPIVEDDFDPGDLSTVNPALIVLNADLGTSNVGAINGRVFCRGGLQDYYGWLIPSVFMSQNSLAPVEIRTYADGQTRFDAVVSGECAAAAFSQDQLNSLNPAAVSIAEEIDMLPYGILLYPIELDLGIRLDLTNTLPSIAADPVNGRNLRLLLGQEALVSIESGDLDDLDEYLASTGLDFSQLGN